MLFLIHEYNKNECKYTKCGGTHEKIATTSLERNLEIFCIHFTSYVCTFEKHRNIKLIEMYTW